MLKVDQSAQLDKYATRKRFSKYTICTTLTKKECIQLTFLKSRVQDLAQTGLNDSNR